jgi:hypothetical protein
MKRRDFIHHTALSSAFLGIGGLSLSSFNSADTKHLTVLHTNDVHSYIDPFPPSHPKNPNMGGVARRAAIIENIRKENPNVLTVDRLQFLGSIKRVSIFSNKTTHQIKLKIAGSELSLSAEDLDFNNEANERLTCSYDGVDMEIGFNSRFLMEMLNNIDTPEIKIQMSEPSRAGLLVPATSDNENEDILMLVMPVMLNR